MGGLELESKKIIIVNFQVCSHKVLEQDILKLLQAYIHLLWHAEYKPTNASALSNVYD